MRYVYVIERANDGSYSAFVPDLPGCVVCGDSVNEIQSKIRETVALHLESLRAHNERVPESTTIVGVVEAT